MNRPNKRRARFGLHTRLATRETMRRLGWQQLSTGRTLDRYWCGWGPVVDLFWRPGIASHEVIVTGRVVWP